MIYADAKEAYSLFLLSDWWRDLSQRKRRGGKCERCGGVECLQSHHRLYRPNWFDTQLEDLEVLCRSCHQAEHGIAPQPTPPKPTPTAPRPLTFKQLNRERSEGRMDRKTFLALRAEMKRQPRKRRKKKIKRTHLFGPEHWNRRKKGGSHGAGWKQGNGKRGLNFNQGRNWVNRGSSSN